MAPSALRAQSFNVGVSDKLPCCLDDMADLLAGLRRKSRVSHEPKFVAQWREGACD